MRSPCIYVLDFCCVILIILVGRWCIRLTHCVNFHLDHSYVQINMKMEMTFILKIINRSLKFRYSDFWIYVYFWKEAWIHRIVEMMNTIYVMEIDWNHKGIEYYPLKAKKQRLKISSDICRDLHFHSTFNQYRHILNKSLFGFTERDIIL